MHQKNERQNFKIFLDNQIKQKEQFTKAELEQNKNDFNSMLNNLEDSDKKDKFNIQLKRQRLRDMNNEILSQNQLRNQIQQKFQRKLLRQELDDAIKEKKSYENSIQSELVMVQKVWYSSQPFINIKTLAKTRTNERHPKRDRDEQKAKNA